MTTEQEKWAVWNKGNNLRKNGNYFYCEDSMGNTIRYDAHDNTNDVEGWEIDHIIPTSKGGPDTLENKQPLQWNANRQKSDKDYNDMIF